MNVVTLIFILFVLALISLLVRAMVRSYKRAMSLPQPKFPVLSICLLASSLALLLASIYVNLLVSDAIGNFLATTAGFLGLLESYMRRKREALDKGVQSENS